MDCLPNVTPFHRGESTTTSIAPMPPGESILFESCEEPDVRQALVEMVMGRHVIPPPAATAAATGSPLIRCSFAGDEFISMELQKHHQPISSKAMPYDSSVAVTSMRHRLMSGSIYTDAPSDEISFSRRYLSAIVSQSSNTGCHNHERTSISTSCSLGGYEISEHQQPPRARESTEDQRRLMIPSDTSVQHDPLFDDEAVMTVPSQPIDPSKPYKASKRKMTRTVIMRVSYDRVSYQFNNFLLKFQLIYM